MGMQGVYFLPYDLYKGQRDLWSAFCKKKFSVLFILDYDSMYSEKDFTPEK